MWTHDVDVADDGVAAWFGKPFSVKEDLMVGGVSVPPALFPFPGDVDDEESDLIYFPGDDSIAFPDDAPGGPFARQQESCDAKKRQEDPPGNKLMASPIAIITTSNKKNLPVALGSKSSAASPVVDKVTGKVLYYKVNDNSRTWSKPNLMDFAATSGGAATKKKRNPPSKLPVVEESKVNSYEGDDEEEKQANGSTFIGNPVIVISNNTCGGGGVDDDVSATSSLSASNAGWYQHQSAVHEKHLRNAVPPKHCAVGVIFVQGSCSERINGIYTYTGMFDFVGIYTKVESYGECKISFRICRRLDETMSRRWYLSIGPGCGGARSDHDIDLYSAPCQVAGPAVCFVDELPPRNNWTPVAGTGLEGTRGPLCLWIPKRSSSAPDMYERGEGVQNTSAPGPIAAAGAVGGGVVGGVDKATVTKVVQESPPSQIIVQKKTKKPSPAVVSAPRPTPNTISTSARTNDKNVFRPCDTAKPCPIILPSKSTDTEVTAATSTLEESAFWNLERISGTSGDTPPTRQSINSSTNTSRSSSLSDLGEKKRPGADVVEYNIDELLDFPYTDDGFPTITSIGGDASSDHEWSDLSDGEEDGIEAHGDSLVRQWTERIAQAEKKKHKVVVWTDDGATETNAASQIEQIQSVPDDEDFQFYARTKAGKQSIIVENIGSALFRRFQHSPRSCRCAACKKEALEAYAESNGTSHSTLFEI